VYKLRNIYEEGKVMKVMPMLKFLTDKYPLLPIGVRKAKIRPEQKLKHVDFYDIKQKFINNHFVTFSGLEKKIFKQFEPARFYGCTTPNCYFYIKADGKIAPCRTDYKITLTKNFDDYNSDTELLVDDLRESILKATELLPACKDCTFIGQCVWPCRFTKKYQKMMQK
jgi:radical SAM protein with 4Fe4S-binding SPASM domain